MLSDIIVAIWCSGHMLLLLLLLLLRSVSISFLSYQFSLFAVVAVIYSVSLPLTNSKIEKTNRN